MTRFVVDIIDLDTEKRISYVQCLNTQNRNIEVTVLNTETNEQTKYSFSKLINDFDIGGVYKSDTGVVIIAYDSVSIEIQRMLRYEGVEYKNIKYFSSGLNFVIDLVSTDIVSMTLGTYLLVSTLILNNFRCVEIEGYYLYLYTSNLVYKYKIVDDSFLYRLTRYKLGYKETKYVGNI